MARERNKNRNDITDRILGEIQGLDIDSIPYDNVLEAIRQGADVSRLARLRFPLFEGRPATYPLFTAAILCKYSQIAIEMIEHGVTVTEAVGETNDVLNALIHVYRTQSDFALLQMIVNERPDLLLKEDENDKLPSLMDMLFYRFQTSTYVGSSEELKENLRRAFEFILDTMEDKKKNIDRPNKYGYTHLMRACIFNVPHHVILRLLEAGANVDATDNNGETALMHASNSGSVDNVRVLLEHGATKDIQNKKGETALMIALRHTQNSNPRDFYAVARLLMDNGNPARTNLESSEGKTAFNYGKQNIKNQFRQNYSRKNNQNGGKRKKRKTRGRKSRK